MDKKEQAFLDEINAHLPEGVDWKQGAKEYLRRLIAEEGPHGEVFHLIKPYFGGPDFSVFFDEMYGFLNMTQRLALPTRSRVLDIACGPGWTSHFLAKLGHEVLGVDISEEMIALARRRIAEEPYRVFADQPLSAEFRVHDMEQGPIEGAQGYDAALFESALHHFYDPISALCHVAEGLSPEGVICIWEGTAPPMDSPTFREIYGVMERYQTLERPYSRDQIRTLLELTGFAHYEFFAQVNGFFNPAFKGDLDALNGQLASADSWNIVIASRSPAFFDSLDRPSSAPLNLPRPYVSWDDDAQVSEMPARDDVDYVSHLFETLLGRDPGEEGREHYVRELKNGRSRQDIYNEIKGSGEYRARQRALSGQDG
ncbi:MAG: methyltransferase domain-containing protein [Gammaproteobacteria bacterium]|jgi:SAM-dependent methyltransferase|nr:methyltransferase domain-containing protein [Gammaproteobacteria bacterium]